jgi:DHA1 family tetracycline resistance protein-like MFS transporter
MTERPVTVKRPLLVAFVTIFLDLLGFGIIIPIQPFFAESFGATATLVTLLSATYSLMQFLFSPFWGRLSDRMGRRPIILFSVAISAVGHFVFACATGLATLYFARALAGFGNANLGTAQAIIADSTSGADRAKGMGLIGAAFGLGFIFGPAIGAFLGQHHPTTPLFAAAGLAVLNFCLAYRYLPETLDRKNQALADRGSTLAQLRALGRHLNVTAVLWITLVGTIAFAQMEQAIALFIEHIWVTDTSLGSDDRIRVASKLTGLFLVAVGITAAIIQGGLIGRLNRRFGEVSLIRTGLVIMTIALAAIPWVGQTGIYLLLIVALAPFMAMGTGIMMPSKSSLLSRSVPASEQGAVMGINQSASALGRVIGPIFAGILFDLHHEYPFYVGAVLLFVTCGLSLRLQAGTTDAPVPQS